MRALALLSWVVTCGALGLPSIADINTILKNATKAIDIRDFDFECSLDTHDNYTTGMDREDIYLNVSQLIVKYNYPVEEHNVTTEDGYILTIIRIPNDGPAVYLMHGVLSSADDFITTNLPNSIAYNLWLDGYDVWMGNARGNKYSRKHVTLDPDTDTEFWDFSWDEIGRIDLPNTIDYILEETDLSQVVYIGHSQGTTAYFVMCSEKSEYNNKVSLMISLSTVAYVSRMKSPLLRMLMPFANDFELISQIIGYHEVLQSNLFTKTFTTVFCSEPHLASLVCANLLAIFNGFDCEQIDLNNIAVIHGHLPAGSSTKQLIHYLQEMKSGKFRKYDYGLLENIKVYGTSAPPDYDVKKITSPVAIFYSDNDWISNYSDAKKLMDQLPNVVDIYHVPFAKFSHTDFLYAKDLKSLVYTKLVELVKKYSLNGKR